MRPQLAATLAVMLSLHWMGSPAVLAAPLPYEGYIVCIDPGHQARPSSAQDPVSPNSAETKPCSSAGASGPLCGPEHTLVLDVGLRLRDLLRAQGVAVVMTRTTSDVDLCNSARAEFANRAGANLAIRLHCNSGADSGCFTMHPADVRGCTDDICEASMAAAELIQSSYSAYTGIPSLGLRTRDDMSGFNWSDVPVILIEMLHLENPEHGALVATPEFRQTMAEGLMQGILAYLDTVDAAAAGTSDRAQ